jgi:hypothetical protein
MIITKGMAQVSGYIEYRYDFKYSMFTEEITDDDRDCMYESDTFNSLSELIEKMKPEVLEGIKAQYDADEVWISCVSFKGKSKDGETTSDLSLYENKNGGHVATKIDNDDIESRLLLNLNKVKQIIDNTIEQYPVKY